MQPCSFSATECLQWGGGRLPQEKDTFCWILDPKWGGGAFAPRVGLHRTLQQYACRTMPRVYLWCVRVKRGTDIHGYLLCSQLSTSFVTVGYGTVDACPVEVLQQLPSMMQQRGCDLQAVPSGNGCDHIPARGRGRHARLRECLENTKSKDPVNNTLPRLTLCTCYY